MTQSRIDQIKADILSRATANRALFKSAPWYLKLWRRFRPLRVSTPMGERIRFSRFSPYGKVDSNPTITLQFDHATLDQLIEIVQWLQRQMEVTHPWPGNHLGCRIITERTNDDAHTPN